MIIWENCEISFLIFCIIMHGFNIWINLWCLFNILWYDWIDIIWMHYVMNMCPKETLWFISIVKDCIGNLCNMYIFIYCYCGWIRQFLKLFENVASPIFFFFLITNRIFVVGYLKYVIFLGQCFLAIFWAIVFGNVI